MTGHTTPDLCNTADVAWVYFAQFARVDREYGCLDHGRHLRDQLLTSSCDGWKIASSEGTTRLINWKGDEGIRSCCSVSQVGSRWQKRVELFEKVRNRIKVGTPPLFRSEAHRNEQLTTM